MPQTIDRRDKVARILDEFPGPVALHQTKTIWLFIFAFLSIGTFVFVWMIWPHRFGLTTKAVLLLGLILLMLWAPFVVGAAFRVAKGLPRMVLHAEGFGPLHASGFSGIRWAEVAGFSSVPLLVLLRYKAPAPGLWKKMNRALFLPAYFGLRAADLARLMNAWRERALAQQHAGPWASYGSSSVSQ